MADFSFILLQTLELFFKKKSCSNNINAIQKVTKQCKDIKTKKLLGAKRTSLKFNGTYNKLIINLL